MADGTSTPDFPPADGPHGPAGSPAPAPAPTAQSAAKKPSSAKKPWAAVAGWTCAVVAGGVAAFALMDAEPAAASPEPGPAEQRPAAPATARGGKPLAKLTDGENSKLITYDDVAAEAMARHGAEVLEAIINRSTVEMACKSKGVAVTGHEVEAEITATAKKFEVDRSTWLQMLESERGLTPVQYKRDVIWPKLALQKLAGAEVTVTSDDVKRAFVRTYGPKVKARMIMLDNIRRAQEVHRQARETPADFGKLAREHSIDATSQALDGVIPPIPMYGSPETEDLERAAFALQPGEISGIIQLPFPGMNRYVILMSDGLTEPAATKLADVRSVIEEELAEQKTQAEVARVFQAIKERTTVHNFVTNTTTGAKPAAPARPAR